MSSRRQMCGVKAAAVVAHGEAGLRRVEIEYHGNFFGVRMFHRVADGLLADAEQIVLDGRSQSSGLAGDSELALNFRAVRELVQDALQGFGEIGVLQNMRAHVPDGTARLAETLPRHLVRDVQVLGNLFRL